MRILAISDQIDVSSGLYVPFRGFDREAGPVGTLDVQSQTVADVSGGTVALNVRWNYEEFGFHMIWIPTMITIIDTLAAAETVEVLYRGLGNERIADFHGEIVTTVSSGFTARNIGKVAELGFPFEANVDARETPQGIISAGWATNTNLLLYELHIFGPVYDAEALARGKQEGKSPDVLLAGVR